MDPHDVRALQRREILLASSSPYRRDLLSRLGVQFEWLPPEADELPLPGELPEVLVARLARDKAQSLARVRPGALIVGSDQVAVLPDGTVLSKPGDHASARRELRLCSGREVRFVTGLCVLDTAVGRAQIDVIECAIRFRELADAEIERYLLADRPYDCAGAFRSEGMGVSLLHGMSLTDPTALVGLPLIRLAAMLREAGVSVP
jgi:MAF protein